MKVIIAGGRDYRFTPNDIEFLETFRNKNEITKVISGGATGADTEGKWWAERNRIPVKVFSPNRQKYGKKAGSIRNEKMAKYAEACILFPGGKETDNMHQNALKYGLQIYDLRSEKFWWEK